MAIKALLLRKKIEMRKEQLEKLVQKDAEFKTREKELEQSIDEIPADISDEDKKIIEEQVEKLDSDKESHENEKKKLSDEIKELEKDLDDLEKEQPNPNPVEPTEEREVFTMNKSKFFGLNSQERDALFMQDEVTNFITQIRTCIKEKRAISNSGLIIPQNFLPMIKEVTEAQSKLLKYTSLNVLTGTSRTTIMGSVPEAIWTEQCGTLNELELGFNDVEMDGFKVGGFFKVCNAILEDNDVDLATELINCLGIAIAKAIDKAIVYGTGVKMPLGFVTRLAQENEPAGYSKTERVWKDLHTSNIINISNKKGIELFKEIVKALKVTFNDYASGNLVWIMNKQTHLDLIVSAMGTTMNALIVSGMGGTSTMPVVGGNIEELDFMKDGDIAFGYMSNYGVTQRKGIQIGQSEHVKFIEEQTVFKGTARYDGKPIIAESFAILNVNGVAPTMTTTFAPDKANTTESE